MGFAIRISIIIISGLFTFTKGSAQLCQGSLGDPIVNITFGQGANPGPSLIAATTSYTYVTNDCPADGFYTVRNNTTNCFGSSWHTLSSDHTGNTNGYFMLVNASFQPSAFYVDTVKGLCTNTTFEFAAWIMNVLRTSACMSNGIQPNLTFTIEKTDGTVLQTYNTGNIQSQSNPTWQQYGFFFTTPPAVSDVVLRIFNNSQGGCGNDLALDDITFRPCGPLLTSSISGFSSNTVSSCEGTANTFTFSAIVSAGFTNPLYQWQQSTDGINWTDIPGAVTNTYSKNFPANTPPGNYLYRLSAAEAGNMGSPKCRVVSSPLTIKVAANPVTTANSNIPLCEKGNLSLTATGGTQYAWTGPNNFSGSGDIIAISNIQLSYSGKYYVLVTNAAGCTHLDSVTINVNPKPVAVTTFTSAAICSGDNIQLLASGGINYKWLPSSGLSSDIINNPVASPADTVRYTVIVSNQFSCSDTAYITINAIERPRANAGPDNFSIAGSAVVLDGSVSGQDISYSWSPSLYMNNPQLLKPVVTPSAEMDYTLTVISNAGCGMATDKTHLYFYKDLFVPTGFTPNDDGKNDTWIIPAINVFSNFNLKVFNRYGQILYSAKNNYQPWDGKYEGMPQPSGVYIYIIDLKEEKRILKGTVTIIR